jgi:hypothetical protein
MWSEIEIKILWIGKDESAHELYRKGEIRIRI